jgi:methyl-CpG-binding domain protein 4
VPEELTSTDERLLQEIFQDDPWKVLVCCVLLNQTGRRQVDRLIESGFFAYYRYPSSIGFEEDGKLEEWLRPLGLQNTRARRLREMSRAWSEALHEARRTGSRWPSSSTVGGLPGVGEYAEDSYRFFVLRDFTRFRSGDKELKKWLLTQEPPHPMTTSEWAEAIEEGW